MRRRKKGRIGDGVPRLLLGLSARRGCAHKLLVLRAVTAKFAETRRNATLASEMVTVQSDEDHCRLQTDCMLQSSAARGEPPSEFRGRRRRRAIFFATRAPFFSCSFLIDQHALRHLAPARRADASCADARADHCRPDYAAQLARRFAVPLLAYFVLLLFGHCQHLSRPRRCDSLNDEINESTREKRW
jgi:hypothetical protein